MPADGIIINEIGVFELELLELFDDDFLDFLLLLGFLARFTLLLSFVFLLSLTVLVKN
jgi:hypothetical protein